MTADHRGESGQQRTVAELLKQYGGDDPSKSGRRRRRAADADDEPPAAPATQLPEGVPPAARDIGVVNGSSGFPAVGYEPTAPGGFPAADPIPNGAGPYGAGPQGDASLDGVAGTGGYRSNGTGGFDHVPRPSYAQPEPSSAFDPASGTGWSGVPDPGPPTLSGSDGFSAQPYRADIYHAGASGAPSSTGDVRRRREESTDFIPRYGEMPAGPSTSVSSRAELFDDEDRAGPGTSVSPRAELFDDDDEDNRGDEQDAAKDEYEQPSGFLGRRLRRRRAAEPVAEKPADDLFSRDTGTSAVPAVALATEDVPAGLAPEDDADEVERVGRQSGSRVWLLLIGQLVLGAIVGAALWIGFSYLWRNFPVVALAAAVLTTTGLVLLVRAIRRSDDLQTTMLAVLVGLVVTISPAVLLLADR
jgi:hypothetical protein